MDDSVVGGIRHALEFKQNGTSLTAVCSCGKWSEPVPSAYIRSPHDNQQITHHANISINSWLLKHLKELNIQ